MALEKGFIWVNDTEAGAVVPPEGHIVYARDTDTHLASDGTTLTAMGGGGGGGLDTEGAQDAVGAMVDASLIYTDATPALSRAALTGDVTASQGSNVTSIANDAVTYAKIQNVTDARLLGRSAGSSGDVQEITVGSGLTLASGALSGIIRSRWLDVKPGSADTPDDDFSSGTLDAKWTVVSGASGTVDLFEGGTTVERYDLSTRTGWMLHQVGRNTGQDVSMYQAYTLPDGKSIIMAVGINTASSTTDTSNNSFQCSLGMNQSATSIRTGAYIEVFSDAQLSENPRAYVSSSVGADYTGASILPACGNMVYFRIARVGLVYNVFVSMTEGITWMPLASRTMGSALTHIWIATATGAAITNAIAPIAAYDWIRQGSNSLDPW